ncbi:MAG TPA: N-acetyltransferase [Thermoanaerobaculia bacterium]
MTTAFRLRPDDAERYVRIRLQMLDDAPWAFDADPNATPTVDAPYMATLFSSEHDAVFGVEGEGADRPLIAVAGVRHVTKPRFTHRARIWGVFADPAHRGQHAGRTVVEAALAWARNYPGVDWVDLSVSENSPAAQRLYESLGFRVWGREPETMELDGRRYDEIYMALKL